MLCQTTVSAPGRGSASSASRKSDAGRATTFAGVWAATAAASRSRSIRAVWSAQTYPVRTSSPWGVVASMGATSQPSRSSSRTGAPLGAAPVHGWTSRTRLLGSPSTASPTS